MPHRCGVCALGNTGLDFNADLDVCGECGGDGQECLDCAGTPDGSKKIDNCGNCLNPWDDGFDTGRFLFSFFFCIRMVNNIQTFCIFAKLVTNYPVAVVTDRYSCLLPLVIVYDTQHISSTVVSPMGSAICRWTVVLFLHLRRLY